MCDLYSQRGCDSNSCGTVSLCKISLNIIHYLLKKNFASKMGFTVKVT